MQESDRRGGLETAVKEIAEPAPLRPSEAVDDLTANYPIATEVATVSQRRTQLAGIRLP